MRNPAQRRRALPDEEARALPDAGGAAAGQAVIEAGLKTPRAARAISRMASVWALDLLALTGRRRNEIVTLKWEMVDWQHSLLDLPDTKTGQLKSPRVRSTCSAC
jgi:integrase